MNSDPPNFDDPTLKNAISGVTRGHQASAALRDRVATRMSAEFANLDSKPLKITPRVTSPLRRILTMAAAIVVGVGGSLVVYDWYTDYADARAREESIAQRRVADSTGTTLWTSMVALHDQDAKCAASQPALTASLADSAALAAEAATQLKHAVATPRFADAGWKLDATGMCTVFGSPAVRFHFVNGTRAVTLVSMPESAWAYRQADTYAITVDEHAIAGYVKDGGLNCIIGDRGMPAADVQRLVDQLRAQKF